MRRSFLREWRLFSIKTPHLLRRFILAILRVQHYADEPSQGRIIRAICKLVSPKSRNSARQPDSTNACHSGEYTGSATWRKYSTLCSCLHLTCNIQCAFGVEVSKPTLCWSLNSTAASFCMSLGYHRRESMKNDTEEEKKVKTCVFW